MHIEYPIDFIHRDGAIFRTETPEEASAHRYHISAKHREVRQVYDWRADDGSYVAHFCESDWIARDALGQTLTADDIPPPARGRSAFGRWYRRQNDARIAAERGLPIPGTGTCHTRSRRKLDWMLAERRSNAEGAGDNRSGLRVRYRKRGVVPCPYDDGERRQTQRCWKKQRLNQWKGR